MKTPRRSFVVEYKGTRRQTKPEQKSIWGNVDLKAIASAVDSDLAYQRQQAVEDVASASPETGIETVVDDAVNAGAATSEMDCPSPPSFDAGDVVSSPNSLDNASPKIDTVSKAPRLKRRAPVRRGTSQDNTIGTGRRKENASRAAGDIADDLEALLRENKSLKLLFRKKLISDNAHLKRELARFQ